MEDKTDWHEELNKRGFHLLDFNTKTYGNNSLTGSICLEKGTKIVEKEDQDTIQVFCPFIEGRHNFNTIRLKNIHELDKYL